ncbi:MAG: ankyrin repeat domain-containing protein [Defluviitaleaceae bacterium]|nr:ankyrin repeat domain-containing protein [Defluviitaleaceae bacterium]
MAKITIQGYGTFEAAPQIAADIISGDISSVESYLLKGRNINKKIKLSDGEYSYKPTPLTLALTAGSFPTVKWLVEHGANLNAKYEHSVLTAVRYCDEDIIRYLVKHGANVIEDTPNAPDAYENALYGKKYKNLPLINELGYTVKEHGSKGLFTAILDNDIQAITFFVENGVDMNSIDTTWGKTTPLCEAARYGDLKLCKYLVAHGADATLVGRDGERPYNIAVNKGDTKMAEFFKSLEPANFHDLQNKLQELIPYKLPDSLLNFLQGDNLRFDFEKNGSIRYCEFIDFLPLTDTLPMKIGRRKLLRISRQIGEYTGTHILWNHKTKMIAFYDEEHEELGDIATFEEFISNVEEYIRMIEKQQKIQAR